MDFPTDAVFGPGCTPDSLSGWDGRYKYEDVVKIATRDDEDGIEVMHNVTRAASPNNSRSIFSSWTSGAKSQEEWASPRIEPSVSSESESESESSEANFLASPSSLMNDLSDLEHSLNDDVSTVKDWLRRVKSERDRLRRDKTSLKQQLTAEKQLRDSDVSRLQAEVALTKAKGEHDRDHLSMEIRSLRERIIEHDTLKGEDAARATSDVARLQKQLDSAKAGMKSLEEALMKEKSQNMIREMSKIEEVRKVHFAQMSTTIAELETNFESDIKEMLEQRKAMLDEEIEAHADTENKLQVVSSEKEQVARELNAKMRELDNLKAENEKYATMIEEKTAETNKDIESLRAERDLLRLARDSAIAEVKTVTTEKEDLSLQLQVKNTELVSLQKQLKEAKSNHIQEYDRAKDQMKKLSELIEVMSNDRDKARWDLKDSQAHVERLIDANVKAEDELRQHKEEAEKYRVEINTLNEARKCFDLYEEESKAEISRLKKRLNETTSDILRSIQSNESEASIETARTGNDCRQDGSGNDILNSKMLALPSLVDEGGTEINVLDEAKTPQRDKSVDDRLEAAEKECDSLRADITRSRRERDALRKMVDTLLPLADGNDMVELESMEKELVDLKAKISKAEEARINVEVEKCGILASIALERDALASQVSEMNSRLLTNQLGNRPDTAVKETEESDANVSATYAVTEDEDNARQPEILLFLKKKLETQVQQTNKVNEELWQSQHMLDAQVKENEKLSSELAALRIAKSQLPDEQVGDENDHQLSEVAHDPPDCLGVEFEERIGELESLVDAHVKEIDELNSELTSLRAMTNCTETDVAAQMRKDIEEIKQEHRIEIKLLKQEHAAIKTKAKLIAKEKDEIANAYEMEKLSNSELETSLEEIVNLFQAERAMHDTKTAEHKIIKKKFSSMRKKRVPVDAAYKACRSMLDRLEGSMNIEAISSGKSQELRSESGQQATNMIELIDILTRALDEPPGSKILVASIYESFSLDKNQAEELTFRGMCLENKVKEMKLKARMDQLTKLPPHSVENACTQTGAISVGDASAQTTLAIEHYEDLEYLRTAYNSLQKKSKHLTKELVDSTKAFEETITSYEAVIAKVKNLLSEKKQENEILKIDLEKARSDLANLDGKMEDIASEDGKTISSLEKIHADTLVAHKEELNAYREAVDVLKRRLDEEEDVKAKLYMEVDRLKTDFSVVVSQFEQELTLSCEANEKALQKKREEREDAIAALSAKEKECSTLATELQAVKEAISNFEQHGGDIKKQNFEFEKKIHSLRDELGQAESDRQQLENAFEQWKESKELEVQELQNKLTGVILSNKECTQVYEQLQADCTSLKADKETALEKNAELTAEVQELQNKLDGAIVSYKERVEELCADCTSLKADKETALEKNAEQERVEELCADCTSLKADKETALEKNAELTADIATLRAENGALVAQKEKQYNTIDLIKNQLESVHKEVRAADEDRIKASRKAGDLENHNRSLREEIRLAEEAKKKASLAADATQNDLMKATKRLDDMLVYTQKLKADHEERELFLNSNMDSQMLSMNEVIQSLQRQVKSIESEKEENRTMYKNDISLQQEVSVFLLHLTELQFCLPNIYISIIELQEIQKLQTNHLDALKKIDSLSDLVSTLKGTLAIEKENAQILLSQFKTSENDRKLYMKQKEELKIEVASRLKSESALSERIHNLEGVETELASRITSENSKAERIQHLEMELEDMHSKINAKEDEIDILNARMMENANTHNAELKELKSKIDEGDRTQTAMHERIRSMESHTASLQQEFRRTLNKAEEEASKLRVILKEAKGKLKQLHDQNEEMKRSNDDAVQNLQLMLNDAIRSRTNTDASLQESLQLLEQQKRIDIKRKGEISKLEQTVEILKSKERYLESYVASLKKQTRRG